MQDMNELFNNNFENEYQKDESRKPEERKPEERKPEERKPKENATFVKFDIKVEGIIKPIFIKEHEKPCDKKEDDKKPEKEDDKKEREHKPCHCPPGTIFIPEIGCIPLVAVIPPCHKQEPECPCKKEEKKHEKCYNLFREY